MCACEGSNNFVREHKGLSFGVRRVCRTYYEDESVAEQGGLGLTSLAPRKLMAAKGVVVQEIEEGIDETAAGRMKYPLPDMREHNIGKHLFFAALEMVAKNLCSAPDYGGLSKEEQARHDAFAEACLSKCERRA